MIDVEEMLKGGMRAVDKMLDIMDTLDAEFQQPIMCMFIDTWCTKNGYDLLGFYQTALVVSTAVTEEMGRQSWDSYKENRKAWAEE